MQSNPVLPPSVSRSPMFKLPRELRDKIYEYAVYSNDDGRCIVTHNDGIREPPLLLTCKTIREEAIEVFYGVNDFPSLSWHSIPPPGFCMDAKSSRSSCKAFDSATATTKCSTMRKPRVAFFGEVEDQQGNLMSWLHYVHAEGTPCPPEMRDHESKKWDSHSKIINSMFKIVQAMKEHSWDEVKAILESIHCGLLALAKQN